MTSQPNKVLLVDDEPKLIAALRRRLSLDFNIVTADGGPKALEMIDKDPTIAVIVADMQMPVMNGVDLLKAVKARAPFVRRLMLTGNSDQETAIAAVNEGGVMRFLRKPCEHEALKAALKEALEDYAFQNSSNVIEPASSSASDQSEAARDAFLSVMNHELRTPLNHIIGFAKLLEQGDALDETENSIEFLKHIRGSGEEMLSLIDRILEFTRLRSASSNGADEISDIVSLVNEEVNKLRKTANMKGITLAVDSLRLKADVSANKDEASLAIRELLSNAVKFNVDGGHVSILIKCDQQKTAVRIANTGAGAPKALLDKIGRPFQPGDVAPDRQTAGIGMGLALVSAIAEANGAAFNVSAGPAGGVVATLVFSRPTADTASAVA